MDRPVEKRSCEGKTETVAAGGDRWHLEAQAAERAVRKSEGVPGGRREGQGLRKEGPGQRTPLSLTQEATGGVRMCHWTQSAEPLDSLCSPGR